MKIVSSQVMREIDKRTIDGGYVSGQELMWRAGTGAAGEIIKFAAQFDANFNKRFFIICGKGNNGGDGFVIAQELHEKGFAVAVFSVCPLSDYQGDALHYAKQLPSEIPYEIYVHKVHTQSGDIIVDCLLGTGLKSDLREPYLSIVKQINNSQLPVVAVDIASGLNGDTGLVQGRALIADLTLTIGLPKMGLFENEGPKHTGRLTCIDIGFPQEIIDEYDWSYRLVLKDEARQNFQRRSHDAHKYKCGNVLVIGGSQNYSGAPMLAARAAARSGAGMTTVICPGTVPASGGNSLIRIPFPISVDGNFSHEAAELIDVQLEKKGAVVIGPGMTGAEEEFALIERVFKSDKKLVVDAGAFIHLAKHPDLLKRQCPTVLTPHSGELTRLCTALGYDEVGPAGARLIAINFKCTVIVKGQFSRIVSPCGAETVNSSGSVALATAGSGDVLAGVIASFASEFTCFRTAVETAVFVHGYAGEWNGKGSRGFTGDDLVEELPAVLKSLSPFN